MTLSSILLGLFTVAGMSAGQILIKLAARRGTLAETLTAPELWAAGILYVAVSVAWIMLLRQTDLSRAYPFMAATFVLVPAFAVIVLGESVTPFYAAGVLLIVAGIVVTLWS
jgi:drug/metabolite transporter (DMT)-like permease